MINVFGVEIGHIDFLNWSRQGTLGIGFESIKLFKWFKVFKKGSNGFNWFDILKLPVVQNH